MRHDLTVSHSIDINVNVSKLWDVLTDPEIIKLYLFGTDTVTDWKPGSVIIFQGEYEGQKYRDKGVILECVQNEKIVYTYWSGFSGLEDKPEDYSEVTYILTPKGKDVTKFTWTQKGFADEEKYNHMLSGVNSFLERIKEIAER